jgi:hypothetical protein
MDMWVIYANTSDYPGLFVVRKWRVAAGGVLETLEHPWTFATLEEARAVIPEGLYRTPRADNDDPVVLETWL